MPNGNPQGFVRMVKEENTVVYTSGDKNLWNTDHSMSKIQETAKLGSSNSAAGRACRPPSQ